MGRPEREAPLGRLRLPDRGLPASRPWLSARHATASRSAGKTSYSSRSGRHGGEPPLTRTLRLRNIGWCEVHGQPVATIGVAISVADAQAMSVAAVSALQLGTKGGAADGCHVYGLLELVMASLGGRVRAIALSVGSDRIVRSWLKLEGPLGACTVPATFSDALVLSQTL